MAKNEKQMSLDEIAKALGANRTVRLSKSKAGGPLEWLQLAEQVSRIQRIGKTFKYLNARNALQPGDVFKCTDSKLILIGHVNKNGGVCDDCVFREDKAVLVRNILKDE
jgi:hypothetical protein